MVLAIMLSHFAIIRPTFFMQNTMMAGQTVAEDGMFYMPCGVGQLGMIDVRDVGVTAAKVLTSDGHEGKTYVLTGPASIGLNDVASILSSVPGRLQARQSGNWRFRKCSKQGKNQDLFFILPIVS